MIYKKLQENLRELVEENPTIENNISLKAKTAKLKKETLSAMRSSWNEKTSTLNLEKDGNKLWTLVKSLNSEDNKQAPIVIEKDGKILSQPATRTALLNQFKTVSSTGWAKVEEQRLLKKQRN